MAVMPCGLPFLAPFVVAVVALYGWLCWKEAGR